MTDKEYCVQTLRNIANRIEKGKLLDQKYSFDNITRDNGNNPVESYSIQISFVEEFYLKENLNE